MNELEHPQEITEQTAGPSTGTSAAEAQPEAPAAPAPEKKATNERSRSALIRYMVILFSVAFILVLISLLVQMRTSQSTINDLNQTSANAMANAEKLQQTNQTLMEENDTLSDQVSELQKQVEEQSGQLDESQAKVESQTQSILAYNTLLQALLANEAGDQAAMQEAMEALKSLKPYLSQPGLTVYENLQKELEHEA